MNQKAAGMMLKKLRYENVVATGIAAIQVPERQLHDVVLMKVQRPEMGGMEASRAICASAGEPAADPRVDRHNALRQSEAMHRCRNDLVRPEADEILDEFLAKSPGLVASLDAISNPATASPRRTRLKS